MAHSCRNPNCTECMPDFVYVSPPEKGTARWKDDMAFQYCNQKQLLKKTAIVKIPGCEGIEIGYMAILYYPGNGADYFRVDKID